MPYKKFSATQLFTGHHMLDSTAVLVTDGQGTVQEIINEENAGDDVQYFEGLLCPGFINTHCHLELSHLKNKIEKHTGLVHFVQQVMQLRNAPAEEKIAAMQQAEKEMYGNGIVAVGDICNTADSIPVKQQSNIYWHNFIEVAGFVPNGASGRINEAKEITTQFQICHLPFTIVPHSPYSVSPSLFGLINGLPGNTLISIHNQESEEENELYKSKTGGFLALYKNLGIDISFFEPTGKSSLQSWLPYFTQNQKVISVHNTVTNENDLAFIKKSEIENQKSEMAFCLCPNANQYISNRLPDVDLLLNSGIPLSLGTDSLASNQQLNILSETETIRQQYSHITTEQLLKWATINGARALHIENKFGSFEKGKQPGVVLADVHLTQSKRIA